MSAASKRVNYRIGTYNLVPRKITVDRTKIVKRGYKEMTKGELSHRAYRQQDAWFAAYVPPHFDRPYKEHAHSFYNTETKLIWKAFDTPELLGVTLFDETVKGARDCYSPAMLDAAEHWVREARYWRCLGISLPFYDENTLRANAWMNNGNQIGTIKFSQAMRDAVMDMERAVRRKELGYDPNYLWDKWTPMGFADGSRSDYLPRFEHNPYVDPDGVDVSEVDIAPYTTHEQLQDRYASLIWLPPDAYEGVFMVPTHGAVQLQDLPSARVRNVYLQLQGVANAGEAEAAAGALTPALEADGPTLRTLFYLSADESLLDNLGDVTTWDGIREALAPLQAENDEKVDAARLLHNTRDDATRVRRFYEEKCGFTDFMWTPDKEITAAVSAYVRDLKRVCATEWGQALACSLTDRERREALGPTAHAVYSLIEDAALDKRRKAWAARFSGEANEEKTLDYMLQNFSRRAERQGSVNQPGAEYDRETEPIGRNVQRRVLDSDKARSYMEERRREKQERMKPADPFARIDAKQMTQYGVRK